jgi:hypothetical protein
MGLSVNSLYCGSFEAGYTEEDGNKALEKFTLVTVCELESGEMNHEEAEDFGNKLIDVFFYSRGNTGSQGDRKIPYNESEERTKPEISGLDWSNNEQKSVS